MPLTIDYYLAPQSPWTYLGHDRLVRMASAAGAHVDVRPMDLGGQVFPVSGGLPLAQRAPQRQAYRLVELARFRQATGLPLNIQPRFFPVAGDAAARLIVAVRDADGSAAALRLTGAVLAAVWAEERDINDSAVLGALLAEQGLAAGRLGESQEPAAHAAYAHCTRQAIDSGVFGSPSYVIEGEIFWGQDRLDFVEQRLRRA